MYTIEYSSAINMKVTFGTMGMALGYTVLSKISKSEKENYHMNPLTFITS